MKYLKKFASYLACILMISGSFTSASLAAAIDVADGATVTSSTTNIDAAVITFTSATDAGSNNAFVSTLNAATAFSVTSMTDEDEEHDPVITVDNGIVTVTGDIAGVAATATDTFNFEITADGGLAIGGDITQGSNKTVTFEVQGGSIEFNGSSAQAIAGTIASDSGNDGVLTLSGAGKKTFAGVIGGGGTGEIGTLSLAAVTEAEFNGTLDAVAITNLGTLQIDGASNADTITNSGTLKVNNTLDNIAGSGLTSIVMHTTASVLSFNHTSTLDQDIVVTATTDGFGTINIVDLSGGAAAAAQVTSGGDIGTTAKRIGTINVGSSAANGALTTIDADAIFVDNFNIIGGDHADEDSIAILAEAITATDGIVLTAASVGDAELNTSGTAVVVTGTVDSGSGTDGNGETRIDADIATTFANNVGATTAIEKMEVAAIQVDLDGATNAIESVIVTGAGTVEFDAASDQTFTGTMTFTADDDGTIINANTDGELTITGAIGTATKAATEITLNDGAKTNFNNAIFALTLDMDTNGETTVFEAAGNEIGDTGGNGGALQIVANSVIELGTAIASGSTVFDTTTVSADANGVLIAGDITIKPSANFTSGTITLIDGDANNISTDEQADILVQDTALTNFTVTAGAQDVTIAAAAKSDTATASELLVTTNEAKSLRQAIESANTGSSADSAALTALNDALVGINGKSATDDTAVAKQIAPQTDLISGSSVAAQAVTGSVQGIMSSRMASLRSGDAYFGTGVAAGGMSAQSGFIQVFGSTAEQNNTTVGSGTQYGYESDTEGLAIGFDGVTDDGMTIGVSLATANTDVDGKGTGKSTNSIDTYSASLYMDRATDAGYIEGSLTYGINENSTSRKVNKAGLDRTYSGSYDSQSLSINISAGAPNEVGVGYLTPFGSFTASFMDIDSYTEKSTVATDALRLKVAQDDINSMIGTLGLKYHAEMGNGGTPMISLAINNEFGDGTIDSTNSYQGGGTAFKTSTVVEELSATLGLGYSYGSDATSIEFAYEADVNDDEYLSHYGSVKIVGKF